MDLIREILMRVEAQSPEENLLSSRDANDAYHVALMKEAGLVDATIVEDQNGIPKMAVILRLTWTGHDFLDSSRDSKIWKLAKEHVIKPGFSWSFSLLTEWLKQEAKRRLFGDQTQGGSRTSEQ